MRNSLLISCLAIVFTFSSCSIEEDEPIIDFTESLVAHYPFDGNTNDVSSYKINAQVEGASLAFDRFGNANLAYKFDGKDDFISIPANEHLNFTDEFTINLWLKTDASHLQQVLYKNISDAEKKQAAYAISIGYAPLEDEEVVTNDIIFSISPYGIMHELRKFDYEKNTWYMITCTLKGDTMYLYINGKPALMKYIKGEISTSTLPLLIGNDESGENAFSGSIDDVRIYSKAKSTEFVSYLYEQ
ncbi:LamG domain-containing protein [Kordia sp. YSTF-M3]|uniref:LamG domain-containing protein n=1 Tax=Kordia aestuariivivens TaxID=2759037 RepID=A0ABR7Q7M2_9FLAO|nr:LamG domain-containing protein [Kordia aestuariivivens]MBC8754570.1 LamG domain-containing protein [Kordia aestuariivivens]